MNHYFKSSQIIRALPSKLGGYNISPINGNSYQDKIYLSSPNGGLIKIERDGNWIPHIHQLLSEGYSIVNARLSPTEITIFSLQGYIDTILRNK